MEGEQLDLGGKDDRVMRAADGDTVLDRRGSGQVRREGFTTQAFGNEAGSANG